MKILSWLSALFSSVSAINWGLVAFFEFNLVEFICKYIPITRLNFFVYGIITLAGIYSLAILLIQAKSYKK